MGATINIFLRVFAGLDVLEDRICITPNLPKGWKRIKFQVRYKNIWFKFDITSSALKVKAEPMYKLTIRPSTVIPVIINKNVHKLHPEKIYTIVL